MVITRKEMRRHWRLRLGFEDSAGGAERVDDESVDAWLDSRIDAWYSWLLHNAPLSMIVPEDIAEEITLAEARDTHGSVYRAVLPERVARVIEVKMPYWEWSVPPVSATPAVRRRSLNPYARGCEAAPVAVYSEGSRTLSLYTSGHAVAGMKMTMCMVAARPADRDVFVLDESALDTISETPTV